MRRTIIGFLLFAGIYINSNAQELPEASVILSKMELANNYFMAKWPDPGKDIVTDKTRPSNLWTRATYYEGLMGMYFISKDTALYQYALEWAESHEWKPTYGNLNTRDGDHQCCGQTYIDLYLLDPSPEKIAPITTNIDNMVNSTKSDDWSWIDAMQMSMPVFAKLGVVHNDQKYFNKMYDLYNYTKSTHGTNGMYNPEDGLWWRDKDFDPPFTTPSGKSCYWSRGNGWVYAALVRVLDVIPETETYYQEYLENYLEMSAALIACQREDGFWNPSMVDPDDFGGKETSGTGFFVYGLAWGINKHLLDSVTYMPAVVKGWNGLQNDALHDNGFLGWVQGTGKQPSDGQPLSYNKVPNFEDFGLGAFLLAGSETYKLALKLPLSAFEKIQNDSKIYLSCEYSSNEYTLHFSLSERANVKVEVLDLNGRIFSRLVDNSLYEAGKHQIGLQTGSFNRGIYLIHTVIGMKSDVIKIKI
ncbi:MAG: glycoside hydrolase family 88 protein [Prolixibacteraceae bacterium]|nr:glycoside hydrolase family 88 protein [Prolixibacteraceae bacterium]